MEQRQQLVDALYNLTLHAAETWRAVLTGSLPDGCTLPQFVRELDAATGAYAEARDAYVKAGYLKLEDGAPELKKD